MSTPNTTQPALPVEILDRKPEKIIFEIQPMVIPTILNFENMTIIGMVFLLMVGSVAFHIGIMEMLIVGGIILVIAIPSLRSIFMAGSTTYVLTTRRLVIFTVSVGSQEKSIPLEEIQSVKCKATGLQRFYNAGEVIIKHAGRPGTIRLMGIQECRKRAEQIQSAKKKAKA
jgi:membrane protein YdbS with pleckstrin-like domain